MATIIDSLLVKLGLDSSEFAAGKNKVDKGLKDTGNEAENAGAKLKKTGKDGAEGFNEVAKSATKVMGPTLGRKRVWYQSSPFVRKATIRVSIPAKNGIPR